MIQTRKQKIGRRGANDLTVKIGDWSNPARSVRSTVPDEFSASAESVSRLSTPGKAEDVNLSKV